jgi:hypothetical protein
VVIKGWQLAKPASGTAHHKQKLDSTYHWRIIFSASYCSKGQTNYKFKHFVLFLFLFYYE